MTVVDSPPDQQKQNERVDAPLTRESAVDLHLHTIASDGFWKPPELVSYLVEREFRVAAVCDHDTQRSVVAAIEEGERQGLKVVPGVEVTCKWNDGQLHVLIYGIDPRRQDAPAQPFFTLLDQIDKELQRNAQDAVERFESDGKPLNSLETIRDGRPLWPFHVLSSAIHEKYVANLKEAAETLTKLGGTFTADLPLQEVVGSAHLAGGLCVLAHPGRGDTVGIVEEPVLDAILREAPLDGLEGHYRMYTDELTEKYRRMALEREMLISCGSDSHGPGQPVDPRAWRADWCSQLLARLGFEVEDASPPGQSWVPGMDPNVVAPTATEEKDSPSNGGSNEASETTEPTMKVEEKE